MRLISLSVVVAAALLVPISAFAQEAVVSGTVADATGGVLPGVVIRAVNQRHARGRMAKLLAKGQSPESCSQHHDVRPFAFRHGASVSQTKAVSSRSEECNRHG